ncbi:hypothetical protein GcC1_082032 [Golovinomyces cichoracearum]|uniref:Uncharacterized protein n=1 Tax=Golovinomyces cichoracearum TaxID=62708 RepID=A0A420IK76_9PEZI|nr:hypothetical protein GcC1_082032 [Golovinomyces cichoracearum]
MTERMDVSTGMITGSRYKYINFDEDEDEIYESIEINEPALLASKVLKEIGQFLKSELNQPMKRQPTLAKKYKDKNSEKCIVMRAEFKTFIKSSNKLIDAIEKKNWVPKKPLTVGDFMSEIKSRLSFRSSISRTKKRLIRRRLKMMQKLWASRKPVSFICKLYFYFLLVAHFTLIFLFFFQIHFIQHVHTTIIYFLPIATPANLFLHYYSTILTRTNLELSKTQFYRAATKAL